MYDIYKKTINLNLNNRIIADTTNYRFLYKYFFMVYFFDVLIFEIYIFFSFCFEIIIDELLRKDLSVCSNIKSKVHARNPFCAGFDKYKLTR